LLELSVSERVVEQKGFGCLGFPNPKLIKVLAVFVYIVDGLFHGFQIIVLPLVNPEGFFEH
jgi:hypothetical protein